MDSSPFSFLTYRQLRELSKDKSSFLLKAELAYKQEKYPRSKKALLKLRNENPHLIDQYLFFRSIGHEDIEEILLCDNHDPLIIKCIEYLNFYLSKPSRVEIINKNFYLYLLLYYFPQTKVIDLAYGYPLDKYGEAVYFFSLYKQAFPIKELRKYANLIKKNQKGIYDFLTLFERETLDLLSRNSYLEKEKYISFAFSERKYDDLKKLSNNEREEVLRSLERKDCIKIQDGIIELLPGGFFLLSCY